MKTGTRFTYRNLAILIVISSFAVTYLFVSSFRQQDEGWLVMQETVLGAESNAVIFSIQDGADSSYVLRSLRTGDAVLIEEGSLYQVVEEFPDWVLVELVDRRRLFVAKRQKRVVGQPLA